jgi:hypothetical protein
MMDDKFIVVTGEEYSPFFELDGLMKKVIVPAFASYSITPGKEKGFKFSGIASSVDEIFHLDEYEKSANIFADKNTYHLLKNQTDKTLLTEFPFAFENPCGIIFRLAMPFYLDIKGTSLVIEKKEDSFYLFEVEI